MKPTSSGGPDTGGQSKPDRAPGPRRDRGAPDLDPTRRVTELVRIEARKAFAPEIAERVIAELEVAALPLIANNAPRVHLALLHLAGGDLHRFDRELRQAKIDWRDTLVAAGLARGDWPQVLRRRGVDWPES